MSYDKKGGYDRGRDSGRDRDRNYEKDRGNDRDRSRDNRDRDRWHKDGYNSRNNNNDRRYSNNNNYRKYDNRNDKNEKYVPEVFPVEVDSPKIFILAEQGQLTGAARVQMRVEKEEPHRAEASRLGELKNKITPVERLWTSHIKQYLNDSEFVEIHRKWKSLANGKVEYGRSIIHYEEGNYDIVYDNTLSQAPIFSRAYFKLWEILELGVLAPYHNTQLTIGCIAEGPGGFIHALVDYREKQHKGLDSSPKDHIFAITLKISEDTRHAKDWSDPRGSTLFGKLKSMGWKIRLSYGKTQTGDLLVRENIEFFREEVGRKCQIVTGDGGIECIGDKEFEYQEVFNVKLFFAEILTALHIQEAGGSFILKIYDCGFELTRQLILLLALYYSVKIVKPVTSRPGNSEKYLLCEHFTGIAEEELEKLKKVLEEWVLNEPKLSYFENSKFVHGVFDFTDQPNYQTVYHNIVKANDVFVKEQEQKLEEGLHLAQRHKTADSVERELRKFRFQQQVSFAYAWCTKYRLATIQVKQLQPPTVQEGQEAQEA